MYTTSFIFISVFYAVPGPPSSIRALPAGAHSIVVSWLPPERPNGVLEHYTLYYRPLNAHRVCNAREGDKETGREGKGREGGKHCLDDKLVCD